MPEYKKLRIEEIIGSGRKYTGKGIETKGIIKEEKLEGILAKFRRPRIFIEDKDGNRIMLKVVEKGDTELHYKTLLERMEEAKQGDTEKTVLGELTKRKPYTLKVDNVYS